MTHGGNLEVEGHDTVDHKTLIQILKQKIKDADIIWLIKIILGNHRAKEAGKGMPLGNLTSQFFGNVYLKKLDQYVKHIVKAKYYIRYVDDFVILENSKVKLEGYKIGVNEFLKSIKLELHPDNSKIFKIEQGMCFLGFRNYYHYKLLKKSNLRKIQRKILKLKTKHDQNKTSYDKVYITMEGWLTYAKKTNTYKLGQKIITLFEELFRGSIAEVEINRWQKLRKTS